MVHIPTASTRVYLWSIVLVGFVSLLGFPIHPFLDPTNLVMLYLLAVVVAALYWGRRAAILAAVLSVGAYNFFFIPPQFTLHVAEAQDLLTFVGLLGVGLVISTLAAQVREQVETVQEREAQTAALYELGRDLTGADSLAAILQTVITRLNYAFDAASAIWLLQEDSLVLGLASDDFVIPERLEEVVKGCLMGQGSGWEGNIFLIPIQGVEERLGVLGLQFENPLPSLLPGQYRLLETFVSQVALAIARERLAKKARQAELLGMTERLQTALLNSISHDLRTPLSTIIGALSSLRDETLSLDTAVRQDLIETATEEAERMNRLVGNLLDMTRLEAGAMKLTKIPCDIQDLVSVVLTQMAGRLQQRPVTLNLPADLPLVPMDFVLVAQVLGNLLDNALKYSPDGTPLRVEGSASAGKITLALRDEGIGIPEAQIPHVFDKFYRVLHAERASGTGLGLSISKGIIEAHGGEIALCSQLGQGTTVWFRLPLADEHEERESSV